MQKFRSGLPAVVVFGALMTVFFAAFFHASVIDAQQGAPAGRGAVQMTVSAEARKGDDAPAVNRDDVMVNEGRDRDAVTSWIPAQGDHAGLELLILVDDGSSLDLPSHFNEIRAFMQKQPATTVIGIGY